jgi:uncharacterized circularly permuted ATP-grasp superfamily protein
MPAERVLGNAQYRREMGHASARESTRISRASTSRVAEGEYFVLEDNLRVPSGDDI